MTSRELKTIKQECERVIGGVTIREVPEQLNAVMVTLPMSSSSGEYIYFFIVKRLKARKFSLILHVESIGISAIDSTLSTLQNILKSYGLLLSQDAVIMEEDTSISLSKRIRAMSQALIGIDGIRRLWKVENNRRNDVIREDTGSTGNDTNSGTSG